MPRLPRLLDYTPAERALLTALYPTAPRAEVLAALPRRAWSSIGIVASEMKIRRNIVWSAADVALLRAEYPLQGAVGVGLLLGKCRLSVTRKAFDLGLKRQHSAPEVRKARKAALNAVRYARQQAARPPRPARVRKAPVPRPPRPVVVKAAPLVPVKLRPMLPVLNAAKQGRKRAEQAAKAKMAITAEQVRRYPANHPARHAYAMGGVLGWQQWNAKQAA